MNRARTAGLLTDLVLLLPHNSRPARRYPTRPSIAPAARRLAAFRFVFDLLVGAVTLVAYTALVFAPRRRPGR